MPKEQDGRVRVFSGHITCDATPGGKRWIFLHAALFFFFFPALVTSSEEENFLDRAVPALSPTTSTSTAPPPPLPPSSRSRPQQSRQDRRRERRHRTRPRPGPSWAQDIEARQERGTSSSSLRPAPSSSSSVGPAASLSSSTAFAPSSPPHASSSRAGVRERQQLRRPHRQEHGGGASEGEAGARGRHSFSSSSPSRADSSLRLAASSSPGQAPLPPLSAPRARLGRWRWGSESRPPASTSSTSSAGASGEGHHHASPSSRGSGEEGQLSDGDQVVPQSRSSSLAALPLPASTAGSSFTPFASSSPGEIPVPPLSARSSLGRRRGGDERRPSASTPSASWGGTSREGRRGSSPLRRRGEGGEGDEDEDQVVPDVSPSALSSLPPSDPPWSGSQSLSVVPSRALSPAAALRMRHRLSRRVIRLFPPPEPRPEQPYPFRDARPFLFPLPPPPPRLPRPSRRRIPGAGGRAPEVLSLQVVADAVAASPWEDARTAGAPMLVSASVLAAGEQPPQDAFGLPFRSLRIINPDISPPQTVPSEPVIASGRAVLLPFLMRNRLDHRGSPLLGRRTPILLTSTARQMSLRFDRAVPSIVRPRPYSPPPRSPPAILPPQEDD